MNDKIEELVAQELSAANKKFPPFTSDMEGWAVLKEELEEAQEELDQIRYTHISLWRYIRGYNPRVDSNMQMVANMQVSARKLIAEAIQVAAMADRYQRLLEKTYHEDK